MDLNIVNLKTAKLDGCQFLPTIGISGILPLTIRYISRDVFYQTLNCWQVLQKTTS